jgi:hypothetical protein
MKWKDFLIKRGEQGKFSKNESFAKYLETVPDFDVPDDIDKLIEENFLTIDRAKADPKIIGAARAEAYSIMDERLAAIMPAIERIDKTLVVDLAGEKDTLKKISKLGPVLDKVAEKAKSGEFQETEKVKELETQKKDLLDRLAKEQETGKTTIETMRKESAEREKNILLDFTLKNRIAKIDFADEFKDKRESLDKLILTELKGDYIYLNESGQPEIGIYENGTVKPKFIEGTNTQATFEKVLEEKVKPFVKRNDANPGGKPKETPKHQQQKQAVQPSGNLTLKQKMLLANPSPVKA